MTASETSGIRPRVVVVAGSGRSGTSTVAGVLKMLGLHIPPPEVPGDKTNPRGFHEPQWAVAFQTKQLRHASVLLTDSRPQAFAKTAERGNRPSVVAEAADWLREHVVDGSELLVKDPRSSWFLPLWRRAASEAGAEVAFLTMLRHPAEVVGSKDKYYKGASAGETPRHAQTTRVASWVNVALFTEATTRDAARSFVLYNDLLDDWRSVMRRTLAELGLHEREFTDEMQADVDEFVDPGLRRVRTGWDEIDCPDGVRELAQEVWEQLCVLAERGGFDDEAQARLDTARAHYTRLYADAEALAQSSADAARREGLRLGRKRGAREGAEPAAATAAETPAARAERVLRSAARRARRVAGR
jgi:hypothetical protein